MDYLFVPMQVVNEWVWVESRMYLGRLFAVCPTDTWENCI